jgi:hypothetical protein
MTIQTKLMVQSNKNLPLVGSASASGFSGRGSLSNDKVRGKSCRIYQHIVWKEIRQYNEEHGIISIVAVRFDCFKSRRHVAQEQRHRRLR